MCEGDRRHEKGALQCLAIGVVERRLAPLVKAERLQVLPPDRQRACENPAEAHLTLFRNLPLHDRGETVARLRVAREVDRVFVDFGQVVHHADPLARSSVASLISRSTAS